MDHPSKEWIDWENYDVRSEYNLDIHVRFNGLKLKDADDHEKCLRWEFNRTRLFEDDSFKAQNPIFFPFYVSSFPEIPYLEHDYKTRSDWNYFEGIEDDSEDLFIHDEKDSATTYEIDMGFFKGKIRKARVPVTLKIDPRWSSEELIEIIRKQSEVIFAKVDFKKKEYESQGYEFFEKPQKIARPISTLKKILKALGHYRIGECMQLGWTLERFKKIYGESTYYTEKIYRESILKYIGT